MKTILIDFSVINDLGVKLASDKTGIKFDYLISLKNDGIEKVFIDLNQNKILAYTHVGIDGVIYNDDVFNGIESFKVEVPSNVILDTDTILEKIYDFGIESLTDDEKKYLSGLS